MGRSSLFFLVPCIELLLPSRNFLSHSLTDKSNYVFMSESSDIRITFHFILTNLYISSPAPGNKKYNLRFFSFKYHLAKVAEANSEISATPLWLMAKFSVLFFWEWVLLMIFSGLFVPINIVSFNNNKISLHTYSWPSLKGTLCILWGSLKS